MNMTYCAISHIEYEIGVLENMAKLVKIVVCPKCGSEMKLFEATNFGNFHECCHCANRVFVPLDRAAPRPLLYVK